MALPTRSSACRYNYVEPIDATKRMARIRSYLNKYTDRRISYDKDTLGQCPELTSSCKRR